MACIQSNSLFHRYTGSSGMHFILKLSNWIKYTFDDTICAWNKLLSLLGFHHFLMFYYYYIYSRIRALNLSLLLNTDWNSKDVTDWMLEYKSLVIVVAVFCLFFFWRLCITIIEETIALDSAFYLVQTAQRREPSPHFSSQTRLTFISGPLFWARIRLSFD